jgi:hypothetical protein
MSFDTKPTPSDYQVVVKRRDPGSKPWRWEIYVAGRSRHVKRSENRYAAMAEAMRDGIEPNEPQFAFRQTAPELVRGVGAGTGTQGLRRFFL